MRGVGGELLGGVTISATITPSATCTGCAPIPVTIVQTPAAYELRYAPVTVGSYQFSVQMSGTTHLAQSPYTLVVSAGTALILST